MKTAVVKGQAQRPILLACPKLNLGPPLSMTTLPTQGLYSPPCWATNPHLGSLLPSSVYFCVTLSPSPGLSPTLGLSLFLWTSVALSLWVSVPLSLGPYPPSQGLCLPLRVSAMVL